MVCFFKNDEQLYYAVVCKNILNHDDTAKLGWLMGNAVLLDEKKLTGRFLGPRKEMITPWSTNAVEIATNMGVQNIERIEELLDQETHRTRPDRMLQEIYTDPGQDIFSVLRTPEPITAITNIRAYNAQEGLALNTDEIEYLESVASRIGRPLTDSEIFGFSQANSEHCRHKIFNGTFIINGIQQPSSLFSLIRLTSSSNPNLLVSAYKDNVAFIDGPEVLQFAPPEQHIPDFFVLKPTPVVISLKAETHNFPTTVEPFNGAATGTGGEIRDRMAGGKAGIPLAGTAVYMTSYSRTLPGRSWEEISEPRIWLYQTPEQILIKASNGASDFGNKFGQPLICGSVLTFEGKSDLKKYGYDKVIMLAGGVGYALKNEAFKDTPHKGDKIILLGGDNYRIGMGGGAVSSVATGEYGNHIELNAVQRSNPEMQKRVSNVIRALAESGCNPVISVHDHGAGGHLNCFAELVEEAGGIIYIDRLPVGDPTLSAREIIGNESQERMGLVLREKDVERVIEIARRERAPVYVVGEITGDHRLVFKAKDGKNAIDLDLADMFGNPPKTVLVDKQSTEKFETLDYNPAFVEKYLRELLQIEAVACKDWLTNKVDRSVTGRVALQQTAGEIQLPLNNLGITTLDYQGKKGIATSIGHYPVGGLIDPEKASVISCAEALTNILWAPLEGGLKGVSLSANWMWPSKNKGEDDRLYRAVKALSDFAINLGINIPTGKDSLSMTQKYGVEKVYSPGTVIISASAGVSDIRKAVTPVLRNDENTLLLYISMTPGEFNLGGSSFTQISGKLAAPVPAVTDCPYFITVFSAIQELITQNRVLAGHDIGSGGMVTSLLEMTFANHAGGINADLSEFNQYDIVRVLFSENPALIIQVDENDGTTALLDKSGIRYTVIGRPAPDRKLYIRHDKSFYTFDIDELRATWYRTSAALDMNQCGELLARERSGNFSKNILDFKFPSWFKGTFSDHGIEPARMKKSGIRAAIIREKGVNGDREMAWSLHLAGFDVKDVHMTDLASGRETLDDIHLIVFVGGFSNSDVLGSAKGWAGAFLFNQQSRATLERFYARPDTLSLGVCNGCQLMAELGLIYPDHGKKVKLLHNKSYKFESAFLSVDILPNNSVMLSGLAGSRLGIWVAHGEGRFEFPGNKELYNIPMKYTYHNYPGNPNGSMLDAAAISSFDGRHLAMMPHIERAVLPWQWAFYPGQRKLQDEVTPWISAFVNAREWIKNKI